MRTRHALPAALVVVAALAAGCTTDSGASGSASPAASIATPVPTSSTTVEPNPEEEAQAAFDNFIAVQNASAQDYYREWDTIVLPLASGDLYQNFWSQGQKFGDGRYHQAGPDRVGFRTFIEIEDGRVVMEVCVDGSGSQIIGPDDAPVPDSWIPNPTVSSVTMKRVVPPEADADPYGQNWWRVDRYVVQTGMSCSL